MEPSLFVGRDPFARSGQYGWASFLEAINAGKVMMRPFRITIDGKTETFAPEADFTDGEQRQHWTLGGLDKLIQLGLWERRLDRRGMVLERLPTVEHVRRLPSARALD